MQFADAVTAAVSFSQQVTFLGIAALVLVVSPWFGVSLQWAMANGIKFSDYVFVFIYRLASSCLKP